VFDAEQLALRQGGSQIAGFSISLVPVKGSKPLARQVTDNARAAISDTHSVAYLGETDPGESALSIPITNDEDLLQVSPTDTALEYTQKTAAVADSPTKFYAEGNSSYGHTFARVVPNSALEARAQAQEMKSLGVQKLYVANDGSEYGAAIALAVANQAKQQGITTTTGKPTASAVSSAGADAVFIGWSTPAGAATFANAVAAGSPTVKLFAPSAVASDGFAAALSAAAQGKAYVSTPGFLPADLTPAGQKFVADFTAAYGHAPASGAIFGYEAMSAVLTVLREAGSAANNRTTVIKDFAALKNRTSVLGTYSIKGGDSTLGPFVFSRLRGGKLAPFKFIKVQG
jgi:ABC-type branched-subunit amino acid transport system substrate-binding protein